MLHEKLEGWWAKDAVSGEQLVPGMVNAARREEMAYFKSMCVYKKVPLTEAAQAGQKPIAVRWIDINKWDRESPAYRSRLVANEFRRGAQQEPELFAPTPPTECLNTCLSKLATKGADHKVLYFDVSRAFFYAKVERPVFVKLPAEDLEPGDENKCGRLLMSMYGTRDAAVNWHHEYVAALEGFGMRRGRASPCLFTHGTFNLSVFAHGDDFAAVSPSEPVHKLEVHLQGKYRVKEQVMGGRPLMRLTS